MTQTEQRIWRKALVHVDEETPVLAYVSNLRWNGWACPVFTKENALRVVEQIDDPSFIEYKKGRDVFIEHDSEGDIVKGPETYMTEDGPMTVYGIGECWTWEEYRPEVVPYAQSNLPTHVFMDISASVTKGAIVDLDDSMLVATVGALDKVNPKAMGRAVWLHIHGILRDVPCERDEDEIAEDEGALANKGWFLSVHHDGNTEFWVITDDGWETTTILLPEEY